MRIMRRVNAYNNPRRCRSGVLCRGYPARAGDVHQQWATQHIDGKDSQILTPWLRRSAAIVEKGFVDSKHTMRLNVVKFTYGVAKLQRC
jgi:hypothetical protein